MCSAGGGGAITTCYNNNQAFVVASGASFTAGGGILGNCTSVQYISPAAPPFFGCDLKTISNTNSTVLYGYDYC